MRNDRKEHFNETAHMMSLIVGAYLMCFPKSLSPSLSCYFLHDQSQESPHCIVYKFDSWYWFSHVKHYLVFDIWFISENINNWRLLQRRLIKINPCLPTRWGIWILFCNVLFKDMKIRRRTAVVQSVELLNKQYWIRRKF